VLTGIFAGLQAMARPACIAVVVKPIVKLTNL
jgi:hypothetical protein